MTAPRRPPLRCRILGHRPAPIVQRMAVHRDGRRPVVRACIVGWACLRCRGETPPGVVLEARG